MGYAFHITRADEWFDSESVPILLDEWERVAGAFPGLDEDGSVDWADIEGPYTDEVERIATGLARLLGGTVQGTTRTGEAAAVWSPGSVTAVRRAGGSTAGWGRRRSPR